MKKYKKKKKKKKAPSRFVNHRHFEMLRSRSVGRLHFLPRGLPRRWRDAHRCRRLFSPTGRRPMENWLSLPPTSASFLPSLPLSLHRRLTCSSLPYIAESWPFASSSSSVVSIFISTSKRAFCLLRVPADRSVSLFYSLCFGNSGFSINIPYSTSTFQLLFISSFSYFTFHFTTNFNQKKWLFQHCNSLAKI